MYHVYLKDHCAVCEKLSRKLSKYQPNYIQILQKVESGELSRKDEDFVYLRSKIQEINLQKLEHMQVSIHPCISILFSFHVPQRK